MEILRFITAGSVDDGKSTLIGRLLYDSKSILADQMKALEYSSRHRREGEIDLALLTDGLRAEREQGITIDVAYKYFSTPKRKFIIADAPGHIQYTRNMVTGASTADLAIIMVDARHGVVEQTIRHTIIASLLGIPHLVFCVNKMDLVAYGEDRFYEIVRNYQEKTRNLGLSGVYYIPVSASLGDQVVERSVNMPWFTGQPLLSYLEELPLIQARDSHPGRFQVQWVIRPQSDSEPDYRGYAGIVTSGILRKGQKIRILPSGKDSLIERIEFNGQELEEAGSPQSIVLHLSDKLDISRGDLIVPEESQPLLTRDITARVCWMSEDPLREGDRLLLQHGSRQVRCQVRSIPQVIDIQTLANHTQLRGQLLMNEIGQVEIRTASPLAVDPYSQNRSTGGFILIDEPSCLTVAACMIA